MLIIVVSIILIPGAASSQLPETGYIGLYTDDTHSSSCITGVGFYPAEIWIWFLPSINGSTEVDFAISYPSNIIQSDKTKNMDLICVEVGDFESGYAVGFCSCERRWLWIAHQTLYITDSTPSWVEIVKHPDPNVFCVQSWPCYDVLCAPG